MMLRFGEDTASLTGYAASMAPEADNSDEVEKPRTVVARNLLAWMKQRDWNQTRLAAESGVSQRHISDIVRGRSDCTSGLAELLAKAFQRAGWELYVPGLDEDPLEKTSTLNVLVRTYIDGDTETREFIDAAIALKRRAKPSAP